MRSWHLSVRSRKPLVQLRHHVCQRVGSTLWQHEGRGLLCLRCLGDTINSCQPAIHGTMVLCKCYGCHADTKGCATWPSSSLLPPDAPPSREGSRPSSRCIQTGLPSVPNAGCRDITAYKSSAGCSADEEMTDKGIV